jgi:hypothetical protein
MMPTPADLERVRGFLRGKAPRMNPSNLLERVRKGAGLPSILLTRQCLDQLRRDGEVSCAAWSQRGPEAQLVIQLAPVQIDDAEQRWHKFVADTVKPAEQVAYRNLWPALVDWPASDYPALIAEIQHFQSTARTGATGFLFSASGRLGSSKLLFGLPKAPLRALGIDADALAPGPTYFIIAGPPAPECVVFVENPNAFERAVAVTADLPVAWISAYGFGGLALDNGQRLVTGLVTPSQVVPVIRAGAPPDLPALLAHPRLHHWGDLDRAGLQIYHAMRARLPTLKLSALMTPMIDLLQAGGGHPYLELTGKPRQKDWTPDDPQIKALLAFCAARAVDQEHLSNAQIQDYATQSLRYPSGA